MENTTPSLLDKLPHVKFITESIEKQKKLVDLFNKRKAILRNDFDKLSEYEQNEREIQEIQTDFQLAKTHAKIKQKEIYVKDYLNSVTSYLEEIEKNYDSIREQAEKQKGYKKEVANELNRVKDREKDMEENLELKIEHYIQLKSALGHSTKNKMQKV